MHYVCFQCFNSLDEGMKSWFDHIGRYESGKTISDAIETYAPAADNDDSANGEYHKIISQFILQVAKASGSADYDRVRQELGCK